MPVPFAAPATTHGALVPIKYVSIGSNTGQVDLTSIPAIYQDLRVVIFGRSYTSASNQAIYVDFNGDAYGALTTYSYTYLSGNGTSASSGRVTSNNSITSGSIPAATSTSGIYGSQTFDILNYANTSTHKTLISRNAADLNGSGTTDLFVGLYRSTSAINQISLLANFAAGTTIALYGIRSVNQ